MLAEVLGVLRSGDVLVVYCLLRLARSVRQLIEIGDDLRTREIGLVSIASVIDTASPAGRFMFTILGALGAMEVEILRERTPHSLEAARARGRVGGRPRVLDDRKIEISRTLLADDRLSLKEVAVQIGCSASTLYRYLGGGRRAVVEARG